MKTRERGTDDGLVRTAPTGSRGNSNPNQKGEYIIDGLRTLTSAGPDRIRRMQMAGYVTFHPQQPSFPATHHIEMM